MYLLVLVPLAHSQSAFVQLALEAMQISLFTSDKQLISIEIIIYQTVIYAPTFSIVTSLHFPSRLSAVILLHECMELS